MPVEPPPTRWTIPVPRRTDAEGLVGIGADLAPGTLLAAYRRGVFPMPAPGAVAWYSPDPRAILRPGEAHESRSLRRRARRFEVRVDAAFSAVLAGCADPRRPGGWITPAMVAAYEEMYALGWAHSVEVWSEDGLAGGLFGIAIGGFFAAESKFHVETDASKVAVVALDRLMADSSGSLIDVQWSSAHLASLGVVEVRRAEYLDLLAVALDAPSPWRSTSSPGR